MTLVTQGYIMSKNTLIAPSEFHAMMLKGGKVKRFSFEEPIPSSILKDRPAPRGLRLSSRDRRRHDFSLEIVMRKDRALARSLVRTIEVRADRRDWMKKADNSGLQLVALLHAKARSIGPAADTTLATV